MFLFSLLSALFSKDRSPESSACFSGTWTARSDCPSVPQKAFDVIVTSSSLSGRFTVDIAPSKWDHSRVHILSAVDRRRRVFALTDNRDQRISTAEVTFGPQCRASSSAFALSPDASIFGVVEAGRGVIGLTRNGSVCKITVSKRYEYSSWSFSVRIFLGVALMYVALQTYYGWDRSSVLHPKSIPIDNPGEEKVMPEEEDSSEVSSDSDFDSDDGF